MGLISMGMHELKIYALQSTSNHLLHGMGCCLVAILGNPVNKAFLVHQPQGGREGDKGRGARGVGGALRESC